MDVVASYDAFIKAYTPFIQDQKKSANGQGSDRRNGE
jgi:hypothetical protein